MPDEENAPAVDAGAALTLSGPERQVLEALRAAPHVLQEEPALAERTGLAADALRGSLERLRSKHLALASDDAWTERKLTHRGEEARARGLPERRFLFALRRRGGTLTPDQLEAEGFSPEEQAAAIGYLRRHKFLAEGIPFRWADPRPDVDHPFPEEEVLQAIETGEKEIDAAIFSQLQRRGLASVERHSVRRWLPSPEGIALPLPEPGRPLVGALTPSLLASGEWPHVAFRPYDVRATVPYLQGARPHPYLAWLEEVEEILIGLGFEEAEGPLLETEFWNADVLNMPQEHPARSVHDMFFVNVAPGAPLPADLVERVAAVHEGRPMPGETLPVSPGWRTPYSRDRARRPVLRSQTTAVSARFLATHPPPPFRMYCIGRNFRPDALDAKHHIEFEQCEGILGDSGVTIRHLAGIFQAFAEALGVSEIKIRPSYFPFTEPSIEGYVRHPKLGWMEVFPGGMLRPEVLRPLGIEVPVAAWGIGIARLAMVALGYNDIRDLYLDDRARLTGRPD
ncbi:MAG: phenylalanine--tRNA ligase subunit alpha [Thermoplasmata archaeon]|nr:phenylalanine--tRNA ligase subunit alpha [Thermoplasmata archaeon]